MKITDCNFCSKKDSKSKENKRLSPCHTDWHYHIRVIDISWVINFANFVPQKNYTQKQVIYVVHALF